MIHFLHLIKFSMAPLLLATPLMLLAIDKNVIRDKGRPRITSLIQRGVGAGVEAFTLSFLQRNKLLELTGSSAATTLIKCILSK